MRLECRFARDNCPSFLVEGNFNELKAGKLTGLNIFSGTFMQALLQRKYSKVSLLMLLSSDETFILNGPLCLQHLRLVQQTAVEHLTGWLTWKRMQCLSPYLIRPKWTMRSGWSTPTCGCAKPSGALGTAGHSDGPRGLDD